MALLDDHRLAMEFAEEAEIVRRNGFEVEACRSFRRAMSLEAQAAEAATGEPTRSVLYRSAATLACDCQEWQEAQRLAEAGLAGDPPEEIREELREVLDRAKQERA